MKIPYGLSDFAQIRDEGFFYADKTVFLPVLEADYQHIVFLRPRRFGKSTLVSLLDHYYDLGKKDRFDALFRGLWIHERPTDKQGAYLVLTLSFSRVATDRGEDELHTSFVETVRDCIATFLLRYRGLVPELGDLYAQLDTMQSAEGLISRLLSVVAATPYKLYLLIDEYDHFANRLLSAGKESLYEAIIKKTGFVRTFYAAIKEGTATGAVARSFITGVSPIMLDDLSSGFNIASHASLHTGLANLAGFTRDEVERALDDLLAARPALARVPALLDRTALLRILEEHYNGYRFSQKAPERVFNADMVLYFLSNLARSGDLPDNMLDMNARTAYEHLHRIGALSGAGLAERRALLETILADGRIRTRIVEQFGVQRLGSRAEFLSLLYFLGMLTLSPAPRDIEGYEMEIPNRVIRELSWLHLSLMLKEEAIVTLDLGAFGPALTAMAKHGEITPFLDLFQAQVIKAFSNRDLRGLDEKTIKLLLMTYASFGQVFYPLSEKEFAQGYGDLFLSAPPNMPGARYSWLLELKYLKTGAKPAKIEAAFAEAETQVARYAKDQTLLPMLLGDRELKAGMLLFVGAQKVLFRPWPAAPPDKPKRGPRRPKPPARSRTR
ncbi:MAG: AAA family ATPase [Byssovorax sp.]